MKSSITFGELLAKHRERLGERVSIEEIFLLHDAAEGSEALSEEDRVEILDRVAADPEAAQRLKSLLRVCEDSPGAEGENVEARWAEFRAQLPRTGAGEPAEEITPPAGLAGWQQVVGLAAALLLCSSLAFWAGRSVSTAGTSQVSAVQLNTHVVELSTSAQRSRYGARTTWPDAAEAMLLSISAPEIESPGPFLLVVLDPAGKTIAERSGLRPDRAGLFFATISRSLLPPGEYEIQLRDSVQEVLVTLGLEIYSEP